MLRTYNLTPREARERLTLLEYASAVAYLPKDAAVWAAAFPDDVAEAAWGLSEQLLAAILDVVNWLQWSKTEDGRKNRNRPRLVKRPGVEDTSRSAETQQFGSDAIPLDELADFLQWGREIDG
ncbi:DUF5361 domain-containing protein [Janibacter melonis]|uniref:DUF5361 domain-containing protein n=1 Tax=Janibacter melonis TaxID=262209 RepID=UPI001CEF62EC